MRVYYVETKALVEKGKKVVTAWMRGKQRFTSCRKAHTAARYSKVQPARVLMVVEKSNLKLPS